MELQLRCVASHPNALNYSPNYALSSFYPRVVTAAAHLLLDHNTSTNAVRAAIRTPAVLVKLVYVGAPRAFVAFLENGNALSYLENPATILQADEKQIDPSGRPVSMARASTFGNFAVFVKSHSPSLWCLVVAKNGTLGQPFKLRSDLEGDQENVTFIDGVVAKVRGKVASNVKTRSCPIAAIAAHPSMPIVAAAYTNGIVRLWNVARKLQQNHFDVQLLLAEKIADLAFHPHFQVLALCTTHGRLLTFKITAALFKRTDQPTLPVSKIRDRKLTFLSICFTHSTPAYILLLTAQRRIIVKMINRTGKIINSTRYAKPSRPLHTIAESSSFGQTPLLPTDMMNSSIKKSIRAFIACEPAFGLIASTVPNSGAIQIFQRTVDGLPAVEQAITAGLDTPFSTTRESAFDGALILPADSLLVQGGALYSYELGKEELTKLCTLPPGDPRRIEVARDEAGYCLAALVFLHADEDTDSASFMDEEQPLKYVLCTRRGTKDSWNVSEPSEGRSGCFLNPTGFHDRIMMLSNSGTAISIFSFQGERKANQGTRLSRGVQRFRLDGSRAAKLFRTPFASWSAVLYHDPHRKRLAISKNAFESSRYREQANQGLPAETFGMDDDTAIKLTDTELVLDVRWQLYPYGEERERFLGAILTDKRIYFTSDVLNVVSKFEFYSIARTVVPFAPPTCSWVGPSLTLVHGSSMFSISMDGNADLIASLSHTEGAATLVAALADRIVYVRPSLDRKSVSVLSRPYSPMSGFVRGALSLPTLGRRQPRLIDSVKGILDNHDARQGSAQLISSLLKSQLTPVAYLILVSENGKDSIPPLLRASFLGRMGDIRGAAGIAEAEYRRLPDQHAFHDGTELYRVLQRVLNMAFASGDVAVGKRCSGLLGRKGTLSSFVDCEGGLASANAILDICRSKFSTSIVDTMRHVVARSSNSSIATDSSLIVSFQEQENMQRAIRSVDPKSIPLGLQDRSHQFIKQQVQTNQGDAVRDVALVEIDLGSPRSISDRLEMLRRENALALAGSESISLYEDTEDLDASPEQLNSPALENREQEEDAANSSDEDIFQVEPRETPIGNAQVTPSATPTNGTAPEEDAIVQEAARDTEDILDQQRRTTTVALAGHAKGMHNLLSQQQRPEASIVAASDSRLMEIHNRALKKYSDSRFPTAQKELDLALRNFVRSRKRGAPTSNEVLFSIVYYQMACRLRTAMDEIATSAHANTIPGRKIYAQLATTLTTLPLQLKHRIEALVLAVDASILIGNFGTAAKGLQMIKTLGVPDELRVSLREKYNACTAKGFMETMQHPNAEVCYMTLKGLNLARRRWSCSVCPAVFSEDANLASQASCPCCGIGLIGLR